MDDAMLGRYTVVPPIIRAVTRENTVHTNKSCRAMCEVLGPNTCKNCLENRTKRNYKIRRYSSRSAASIGADVAAILSIRKAYPQISEAQLQQKLNTGLITPLSFAAERSRRKNLLQDKDCKLSKTKTKSVVSTDERERLFFSDMNDLRLKISIGVIPKSVSNIPYKPTVIEKLYPPFISPRVVKRHLQQLETSSSPLTPPLLPVDSQCAKPQFFAGQAVNCPLPTPLGINEEYLKAIDSKRTSAVNSRVGSRVSLESCLSMTGVRGMRSREQSLLINPFNC